MSGPPKRPRGRIVAMSLAAVGLLILGSFLLARHASRAFFRDTASFLGEIHVGPNWVWWQGPLGRGFSGGGRSGPWRAWACESESCDFAPAVELSLTGGVVRTVPSDLARRLADER